MEELQPAFPKFYVGLEPQYYKVCKKCGFSPTFSSGLRGGELMIHSKRKEGLIRDLHVLVDLKGEKRVIHPSGFLAGWILGVLGKEEIEEHFKIIDTTERLIKVLKKLGYRNIMEVEVDEHILYKHPERARDVRSVIHRLAGKADENRDAREVRIRIMHMGHPRNVAEAFIRRVHPENDHTIEMKIGKIDAGRVRELVKTLEEKLEAERVEYL